MLGRQVTFLLRRPLPLRLAPSTTQHLSARSLHTSPAVFGITASKPGRPKKAVGEPSRVIKRAVKRVAKKPAADPNDAASRQVAEKQAGTTPKTKAKAAKPKAAKKATPPKKVYTEAELAAKKERAAKTKAAKDVKSLKAAALSPPSVLPANAYLQFVKAHSSELKEKVNKEQEQIPEGAKVNIRSALSEHSKNLAAAWKSQSSADIEHFNHLAYTATESSQAAYKSWVQSHTPDEIKLANSARRSLRRRELASRSKTSTSGSDTPKNRKTRWPAILDEREPKAAVTPYIQFSIARNASGDFKHLPLTERSKLIGEEWKALAEGEKKKYETLHSADRERYIDEYSSVHGHAPLAQLQSQHPELTQAAPAA